MQVKWSFVILFFLFNFDQSKNVFYSSFRFYDPKFGRFLQADTMIPYVESLGMNRFSYGNNNPIKFTDPDGHWAQDPKKDEGNVEKIVRDAVDVGADFFDYVLQAPFEELNEANQVLSDPQASITDKLKAATGPLMGTISPRKPGVSGASRSKLGKPKAKVSKPAPDAPTDLRKILTNEHLKTIETSIRTALSNRGLQPNDIDDFLSLSRLKVLEYIKEKGMPNNLGNFSWRVALNELSDRSRAFDSRLVPNDASSKHFARNHSAQNRFKESNAVSHHLIEEAYQISRKRMAEIIKARGMRGRIAWLCFSKKLEPKEIAGIVKLSRDRVQRYITGINNDIKRTVFVEVNKSSKDYRVFEQMD